MSQTFFGSICQVGIFIICAQTFVHFCPKGDYEKYLKMLVSIMVLILILSPIGKLVGGTEWSKAGIEMGEWWEQAMMEGMDEILEDMETEQWTMSEDTDGTWEEDVVLSNNGEISSEKENSMEQSSTIYVEPIVVNIGNGKE